MNFFIGSLISLLNLRFEMKNLFQGFFIFGLMFREVKTFTPKNNY